MKPLSSLKTVILIAALIFSGLAYAHSGAKGVIKQRMDAMSDIAKNMKIIGAMMKNGEFNALTLSASALNIQNHANQISEQFPTDSLEMPSEALPAIWVEWDDFIKIADKLGNDAGKLAGIATSSMDQNEVKTQFQLAAKSCSGCHEKFRLKK